MLVLSMFLTVCAGQQNSGLKRAKSSGSENCVF